MDKFTFESFEIRYQAIKSIQLKRKEIASLPLLISDYVNNILKFPQIKAILDNEISQFEIKKLSKERNINSELNDIVIDFSKTIKQKCLNCHTKFNDKNINFGNGYEVIKDETFQEALRCGCEERIKEYLFNDEVDDYKISPSYSKLKEELYELRKIYRMDRPNLTEFGSIWLYCIALSKFNAGSNYKEITSYENFDLRTGIFSLLVVNAYLLYQKMIDETLHTSYGDHTFQNVHTLKLAIQRMHQYVLSILNQNMSDSEQIFSFEESTGIINFNGNIKILKGKWKLYFTNLYNNKFLNLNDIFTIENYKRIRKLDPYLLNELSKQLKQKTGLNKTIIKVRDNKIIFNSPIH